jgi:hypothetical protein
MFEIKPRYFPNLGWLEIKLSTDILNFLNECIKNKKQKYSYDLAGNIEKSYLLEDKNDWFFKNVLVTCIKKYIKEFSTDVVPTVLTKDCEYVLTKLWVNYQKKTQFNPTHNHFGVFSFVIWIDIPSSFAEESKVKFVKHSNCPVAGHFQFLYTDILGVIAPFDYRLGPPDEGTMLFFPSSLRHQVYPFYTSNKNRVSISGNVALNPEKIV